MVAFILACVAGYNTIATARKNRREEKKERENPINQLIAHVNKHDESLENDKRRMDEFETRMGKLDIQSTIMLRGVRALLSHEVNGNSVDKLNASLQEIDNYLIERK